jgi:hypothetical protein
MVSVTPKWRGSSSAGIGKVLSGTAAALANNPQLEKVYLGAAVILRCSPSSASLEG